MVANATRSTTTTDGGAPSSAPRGAAAPGTAGGEQQAPAERTTSGENTGGGASTAGEAAVPSYTGGGASTGPNGTKNVTGDVLFALRTASTSCGLSVDHRLSTLSGTMMSSSADLMNPAESRVHQVGTGGHQPARLSCSLPSPIAGPLMSDSWTAGAVHRATNNAVPDSGLGPEGGNNTLLPTLLQAGGAPSAKQTEFQDEDGDCSSVVKGRSSQFHPSRGKSGKKEGGLRKSHSSKTAGGRKSSGKYYSLDEQGEMNEHSGQAKGTGGMIQSSQGAGGIRRRRGRRRTRTNIRVGASTASDPLSYDRGEHCVRSP